MSETTTKRTFTKATRQTGLMGEGHSIVLKDIPVLVYEGNCFYLPERAIDTIVALENCAAALANIEARTSREPEVSYVLAEVKEPLARLRELGWETP